MKCIRNGCQLYVVEYINAKEKISTLGNLPSVQDIVDVFLEGFLGLSPKRDIDFTIEIVPIIALVSRALYHMSVPELTELKMQLQVLLEKKYILSSLSP